MKGKFFIVVIAGIFLAFAMNTGVHAQSTVSSPDKWGVGIRLGDPSGLTVKRYLGKQAIELNVGRTRMWGHRDWYNNRFDKWYSGKNYAYTDSDMLVIKHRLLSARNFIYCFITNLEKAAMQWTD